MLSWQPRCLSRIERPMDLKALQFASHIMCIKHRVLNRPLTKFLSSQNFITNILHFTVLLGFYKTTVTCLNHSSFRTNPSQRHWKQRNAVVWLCNKDGLWKRIWSHNRSTLGKSNKKAKSSSFTGYLKTLYSTRKARKNVFWK